MNTLQAMKDALKICREYANEHGYGFNATENLRAAIEEMEKAESGRVFNAEQQIYRVEKERNEELSASRAREAKLREALEESAYYSQLRKTDPLEFCGLRCEPHDPFWKTVKAALDLPHDDMALKEYGKKEYERGWDDGHIAGREKISGLKEYRRKVLLEAAERIGSAEFMSSPEASKSYAEYNELRRMAEEG